eukprot:CAMPEP_0118663792 /NCGR_PEP_ID=MMETSP0785-20121206/17633_1 /TAXON_ID=91992 /ORGANISM="Bolidomonas pacifica, Strain CCMP 1866" /LENGTH=84 /DNA_ID=CAMNT_0006557585 /DNA_START=20 /DNA_END=271 /DNA_ORIENTATION=-
MNSFHQTPIVMGGLLESMKTREREIEIERLQSITKRRERETRRMDEAWISTLEDPTTIPEDVLPEGATMEELRRAWEDAEDEQR